MIRRPSPHRSSRSGFLALPLLLTALAAPAAAQEVLVGWWTFDGSGADQSGAGRDVAVAGGAGFAPGIFGQALDLHNNGGQYAVRPGDDSVYDFGTSDFVIQVRVNFNNTFREQTLIEKFSGSGGPGWTLTKLNGDALHFYCAPAVVLTSAALPITSGEWHHIVARRNGTLFQIIYDGTVVASGTSSAPVPDTGMPLLIGKRNDHDGRNFAVDGRIDDVAIWRCGLPGSVFGPGSPVPTPVAHAGADQSVSEGALVTLDGSGSSIPCGVPTLMWSQVAGTPVLLDLTDPAHPTFVAPLVPIGGESLSFQLVVVIGALVSPPVLVNVSVVNVNHAPVAMAGDDQFVHEASPVSLDGHFSFDPDGDPLTFTWIQTAGAPVVLDVTDPVRPAFLAPFVGPGGDALSFMLTVSDSVDVATDTVVVYVENVNHAPTASAGTDQTRLEGSAVTLDGSASSDPDGDALAYAWLQVSGPVVTLAGDSGATPGFTAPDVGPGGAALVFRLTVDDGQGAASDEITVTVQDGNAPPACALARPSVAELWPPNHRLVPVEILGVTDPDSNQIAITILAVTQDEPVNGLGDGDTGPDAVIQGSSVLLRAERAGGGNGRVYRVTFQASDGFGGSCTGEVRVCVPPSKGRNVPPCVDDGQIHTSN